MTTNGMAIGEDLQRILWACLAYWSNEPLAFDERVICYSWVARLHQNKFGVSFAPSKLRYLGELGLLAQVDTSRGGDRRYWRINDPQLVAKILHGCNFN